MSAFERNASISDGGASDRLCRGNRRRRRKLKVVAVVGTRPEAIKMAPVIQSLRSSDWCECVVVASAQHRDLLDQALALFGIAADIDLDLMRDGQTLAGLTSRLFSGLDRVLMDLAPDLVIAQGDTTTVMVASVAAFYRRIPFAHVEAGLRTGDLGNPFPEELNRIITGRVAAVHFAPTQSAAEALAKEGVCPGDIHVTGNTVIDALFEVAKRPAPISVPLGNDSRLILLTAHRRESFGEGLTGIFFAVRRLVEAHRDVEVIFPVHPNPSVRAAAQGVLGSLSRVHLVNPLRYDQLVSVMSRAHFVLTDSGGLQEEAPALGKPVLVLRDETERPEAVQAGVARLVGTTERSVYEAANALLTNPQLYSAMSQPQSPYGDGHASARIAKVIEERFGDVVLKQNQVEIIPQALPLLG
jgi:UDP-N-acetylglucosamine 2-epimerase (non-hydrolysing)